MIAAILIGRGGGEGLPGKNTKKILGRPLMSYPLLAAKNCKYVDKIFVSTDSDKIKKVAKKYKVEIIDRPKKLATRNATVESVFYHAYNSIKKDFKKEIEFIII